MVNITKSTKTPSEKDVKREWRLIDLNGVVLGRAASKIASFLQGKNKVNYVPNIDMGDNIVVINAHKVVLTGRKIDTKEYDSFSGYPGGRRTVSFKSLLEKHPEKVIRNAVSGMLPKNKLRDPRLARLHVYGDTNHKFADKFK